MPAASPPQALFDTVQNIEHNSQPNWSTLPEYAPTDYQHSLAFLISYKGSQATFNAYRREIERLLHWAWQQQQQSVCRLRRADIEQYLAFCQKPPLTWIGIKKTPRFIVDQGQRKPNQHWRPFVVTLSKVQTKQGIKPNPKNYRLSDSAIKEIFAILSSYYQFLIQEEASDINPISHIRQKNQFLRKRHGKNKIRRLSELQWEYVIETATQLATQKPHQHERTLFIMSALFLMYLRISELAVSQRWSPQMNDFYCDHDGNWWFTVVGKGNKERDIAVSDTMINTLKRWRQHLQLSPLPSTADQTPLLPKLKGHGGISNTSFIRKIVQNCFDQTSLRLTADGFHEEAANLDEATVHWLRHTGISEDVKRRPREHVRDDAGHSSGAITDQYIDIEKRERHASAKHKTLSHDQDPSN